MKISSASDFKDRHRKKLHELPSGLVVELYKIDPLKMISDLGFAPKAEIDSIDTLNDAQREEAISRMTDSLLEFQSDKTRQIDALYYIVLNGVSDPKVTNEALEQVAEDEVHITDFGEDLDQLIEAIVEFSGFNRLGEAVKEA